MAQQKRAYRLSRLREEIERQQQLGDFVLKKIADKNITQTTLAKLIKVSQPTISDVVNGKISLRREKVLRLAVALELNETDRITLYQLAGYAIPEGPFSIDTELLSQGLVDIAEIWWKAVYQTRMDRSPDLAILRANEVAAVLRGMLTINRTSSAYQPLTRRLGLLNLEKVIAYSEIHSVQDAFRGTRNSIREIRTLAKACGDQRMYGLAQFLLGNNYYLVGHYLPSVRLIGKAIDHIEQPDEKLWVLRHLALDYAYLGDKDQFADHAEQIQTLIEDGHVENQERICEAYEALSRGWGVLRSEKAFPMLEKGWTEYQKLVQVKMGTSTRFAQLVRGELTVAKYLGIRDPTHQETLGKQGIDYANRYKYRKYAEQIESLLNTLLG